MLYFFLIKSSFKVSTGTTIDIKETEEEIYSAAYNFVHGDTSELNKTRVTCA